MQHFSKKPVNDWSDRWNRAGHHLEVRKRGRCVDHKTVHMLPKWNRNERGADRKNCTHSPPVRYNSIPVSHGQLFRWVLLGQRALIHTIILCKAPASSQPPLSPLLWHHTKKQLHARVKFAFYCCFGVTVVRLSVCGAEVTAADSYLRGCWRATGGARLLPLSSASISSLLAALSNAQKKDFGFRWKLSK